MLDTNVVSDMIRNPGGRAALRARGATNQLCVSVIVAAELQYGCAKSRSERLQRRVGEFLTEIEVLPYGVAADREYGRIRAELESSGTPIGSNDLLIAAHAVALGMTVVTANMGEFRRVRGLKVVNWLA